MSKILLVDDDKELAENVEDYLKVDAHIVEKTHTGEDALEFLRQYVYDLVILDWGLPGLSGVEVLRKYRAIGGQTPILMLTGKETLQDKEIGLDAGADDYLTKPFHLRELAARVRALLRRPTAVLNNVITVGNLSVDIARRTARKDGKVLELLPKEYALLEFFLRHPDQVFDPNTLLDRVWHSEQDVGTETVRTHITRLRKKIDSLGKQSIIKNVHGQGYRLEPPT
jgi:DNA-binding response OmpR family regulator